MEKIKPILSVIVPVYNVEPYLSRCVDSILSQSFTNLELILVDDGSTDRSGNICDEYEKKDDRVIVCHQPNRGVAAARNRGLDLVRGEYITFVDSDDQIGTSTTYEENMAIFKKDARIDVVQYPIYAISADNRVNKSIPTSQYVEGERNLFLSWYQGNPIRGYVWDKIFKKNIFDTIRFPKGMQLAEDAYCIVDFVQVVKCLYISELGIYNYFQLENSAVRNFSPKKSLDRFMCGFRIFSFLCALPDVSLECSRYFFSLYKDYLNTQIAYHKKIDLKNPFIFICEHIPDKSCIKLESSLKNKLWYFLFQLFGMRLCSAVYIEFVLMKLKFSTSK
ncbi:glycosyltransferase family 2 protein [Barnesiella viscericola]|uniref:Glycosyltransferase n=1 Tax=Barnesiella viscericola TaxID=397865 RepID=A0A921SVD0_9BACT|nr:glycosyltransferase [Barnesiella viscericola]HJG89212.1 glycosyltransferase [Barnesiella viscericola]